MTSLSAGARFRSALKQKNDNKGSDNKTSVRVSKPQVKVISKKTDNTQANSDD